MVDRMKRASGARPKIQIPIERGWLGEIVENSPRGVLIEAHLRPLIAETAGESVTAFGHPLPGRRPGRLRLRLGLRQPLSRFALSCFGGLRRRRFLNRVSRTRYAFGPHRAGSPDVDFPPTAHGAGPHPF